MTIRELFKTGDVTMTYGDIDIYNDVTDECAPAYCGTRLTPEGERHFAEALDLEIDIKDGGTPGVPYYYGVVKVFGNLWRKYWGMAHELFASAAGYCSDEDWDKWFGDEDELA